MTEKKGFDIRNLPRGGYVIQTPDGWIQFGIPPETIKDTMLDPGEVPCIYVVPPRMFSWLKGINLADIEFPVYYNFFLRKRKTLVICRPEQKLRLIAAFREAAFGPEKLDIVADVHPTNRKGYIPDIAPEMAYYRGGLTIDAYLDFQLFEQGSVKLGRTTIRESGGTAYEILVDGERVGLVPREMEYQARYAIGERVVEPYEPPLFGVTCLGPSHGFDPKDNTSGFIIWLNHCGIMVDPPVNSAEWLRDSNVDPKRIDSIVLTHCHADHDAGTFQKILQEGRITLYSTKTVLESFLRKYSSLSGEPDTELRKMFIFQPVYLGKPVFINGGEFRFFYTLHSIPTIGFTLKFQNQSFVYSSDHQGDPEVQKTLLEKGVLSEQRFESLSGFPWDADVIYHESGIAPLHTPIRFLSSLPPEVQAKTVVYHIAKKDFPDVTKLRLARFGIENTLYFQTVTPPPYEKMYRTMEVLKHLEFLNTISVDKIQEFLTIIEERKYAKGDYIIRKGTAGSHFYVIVSGNVAVVDGNLLGKKLVGIYESFGEVSLLTDYLRTADIVAETEVTAYVIEKDHFLSFIAGTEYEETLNRVIRNRGIESWNLLSKSPYFRFLSTYQKTWLESVISPFEIKEETLLIAEQEPAEAVYLIRSGAVKVTLGGDVIRTLETGDLVGSLTALSRGERSPYRYTAEAGASLYRLASDDLLQFLDRNPGSLMKMAETSKGL